MFHTTRDITIILILVPSVDPAIPTDEETDHMIEETMTTIDLGDGTARGTVDTLSENDLRTDGDDEVENEITGTGETILMIGHGGAARTLLTYGPVVEEKIPVENLQAGPNLQNQQRSVHVAQRYFKNLMYLSRARKRLVHLRRARLIKKLND